MARDFSLPLRRAVVKALRADGAVSGVVGSRVHAEQPPEPQAPWVRVGRITAFPFETSTEGGSEISLTLHAFAPSSDEAHRLAALIVYALDEKRLPLEAEEGQPEPGLTELFWTDTDVMPDTASKADYHAVIRLTAVVTG